MITFETVTPYPDGKFYKEGACLSSDTKPTNDPLLMNGSKLLEIDTSTLYMYDAANKTWKAWE